MAVLVNDFGSVNNLIETVVATIERPERPEYILLQASDSLTTRD